MANTGWQRAIVVGASSGMGEALARQLAQKGCQVALVARREVELARVANVINRSEPADTQLKMTGSAETKEPAAAGPSIAPAASSGGLASTYIHDVREYACVPALFQQITHDLGGLDIIIYAAGVMPLIGEDEYDFEKDRLTFETNVLGAMAWLNQAAQRFERARSGTIVGISSVAGDRGRRGFPAYCASKAALNTYLEALRNRVGRHGVHVITVKPGPVDTPMTKDVVKKPMLISAEEAATAILAAAATGKRTAYVPGKWRPIMWVLRSIPSPLFQKLNI